MATLPGKKLTDYIEATNLTDDDLVEVVQGGLNKKVKFSLVKATVSNSVEWNAILNKPTTFPPSAHTQEISTINGLQTALDAKAADSTVVKLTGDQNVSGVKTFAASPIVPNPTTATQVANKDYVDGLDSANVKLTGDQTIAGVKTFSSAPILDTAISSELAYFGATKEFRSASGVTYDSASGSQRFGQNRQLRFYNTVDQVTNTEIGRMFWNANAFYIDTVNTGTGVSRNFNLAINGTPLIALSSAFPLLTLGRAVASAATSTFAQVVSNFTAASGTQLTLTVAPTIAQTGTAAWTAFEVNPTITSEGSGNKFLMSWKLGGAQRGSFNSVGNFNTVGSVTAGSVGGITSGNSTLTSNGSFAVTNTTIATNTTLGGSHGNIDVNASADIAVTLPAASTCNGRIYTLTRIDGSLFKVTILPNGAEQISGQTAVYLNRYMSSITLESDGTRWLVTAFREPPLIAQSAPFVNLMSDSGKITAKTNPLDRVVAAFDNVKVSLFLSPYNSSSAWAQVGKFIFDNSTNGGAAGALTQPVIDLLTAQGRTGVGARYGVEYYVIEKQMGSGTLAPHATYTSNYLATVMATSVTATFGAGNTSTFTGWIRVIDGTQLIVGGSGRTFINGVPISGSSGYVLTPAMGWVHIRTNYTTLNGYANGFPYIYAETNQHFQLALPAFFCGDVDVGIHVAPIQNINELIP